MTTLHEAAQKALEALTIADNIALVGSAYTPRSIDAGLLKIRNATTTLRSALAQGCVTVPQTEQDVKEFIGGNFCRVEHRASDTVYTLTTHDLLSAFREWVPYPAQIKQDISAPQAQQPLTDDKTAAQIYEAAIRARSDQYVESASSESYWKKFSQTTDGTTPTQLPLTDEQIKEGRTEGYDAEDAPDAWDFEQGVRFAERHHGIGGKK